MRFIAHLFLPIIVLAAVYIFLPSDLRAQQDTANPYPGWQLIWSDEFDGPAGPPDPAKWTFEVGHSGWGNQELENYTTQNARLDGMGHLVISALRENGSPFPYTSARINTHKLFSVQYGMVEARMKLPAGPGLWPAFWLLGENIDAAGWPKCGEIDIMENVPQLGLSRIASTIHASYLGNAKVYGDSKQFHFPAGQTILGYHIYGMIWSPRQISFFIDDPKNIFVTFTRNFVEKHSQVWAFDHPFFIIFNVAVGGDWPGKPDNKTIFPAQMVVDYVRVYKNVSESP
ncbi:MAG TPA: glycoside hydrolase family 16 protein [Phycisphaerae bacterium]|nr:glycoside hydrolase family 16 protein [Phycisphaerae bacterium]